MHTHTETSHSTITIYHKERTRHFRQSEHWHFAYCTEINVIRHNMYHAAPQYIIYRNLYEILQEEILT